MTTPTETMHIQRGFDEPTTFCGLLWTQNMSVASVPFHKLAEYPDANVCGRCSQIRTNEAAARLDAAVAAQLPEGWTFGYLGNCSIGVTPGAPAYFDDRSWFIFAPHPGRPGTYADRFGGFTTADRGGCLEIARAIGRAHRLALRQAVA